MQINLSGKTALVAGSTQGIGKAIALELAKAGANIVLLARNESKLQEVLKELDTSQNQLHSYLVADFNQPHTLQAVLNDFSQDVQILVNNTGGPAAGKAIDAHPQDFLQAFQAHLICNQILVQKFVESMKKAHYGRIINIISTSVKQPLKNLGVSNTIRGAVANWAKTLANELASWGITVNNILPGATWTTRLESLIQKNAQNKGISFEEAKQEMLAEIPAQRFAQAQEIAFGAVFLASPQAAYITGTNLVIDGGRTGCL
ncbi:MAG: SDR family oxidoreductase [Raineya sp.]|nr:SDR family oxidoreductase [Raineya sp.]